MEIANNTPNCHSERSEESLPHVAKGLEKQILRFAQDDKLGQFRILPFDGKPA